MPLAPRPTTPRALKIALKVVLGAAIVDAVFLAPLFVFGYVYLLYLTATGAMRGTWGWGFFGLVAVTLGPAGAIFGARRMRAEADEADEADDAGARPTRKEQRKAAAERRRGR